MRFLRTNTAIRVTVGPFIDKTDGVTPETALTVTSCKLTLMVDDGNVPTLVLDAAPTASGGSNDMVHVTGDDAGFYDLELAAGNVNYLGRAMLAITDAATHCPVFHEFMILPAMVYDSLVLGTDRFDANVTHVGDTAQTARDLGASVLLSPGTGTGQLNLSSGAVLLQATQTGVTIPTVTTLTNAPSDSSGTATLLSRLSSARAGYLDNLSAGAVALASTFSGVTSLAQWLGLIAGKQTGDSTARTELRATGAGSGTYDETTDSQEAARDSMGTAQTGDAYARLGAPAGASVSADVAAIKAKTDNLTFTSGTDLDVNVQKVNDVALTGVGTSGDPWGPV